MTQSQSNTCHHRRFGDPHGHWQTTTFIGDMRLTGMLREAGISLIAVDIHGAPVVAVRVEHDVKVRHEDRAIRRSSQEGYVGTKTCKESAFCFGNPDLARANEIEFIAHDEAETTTPGIAFTRFLEDGRICMTNNAAERALRGIAVGRRNWTFAGSDAGGQRAAAVYSLVETALCRARHKQVYAARRTMPNAFVFPRFPRDLCVIGSA